MRCCLNFPTTVTVLLKRLYKFTKGERKESQLRTIINNDLRDVNEEKEAVVKAGMAKLFYRRWGSIHK